MSEYLYRSEFLKITQSYHQNELSRTAATIEEIIEHLSYNDTRFLYWGILDLMEKHREEKFKKDYLSILEIASKYIDSTGQVMGNTGGRGISPAASKPVPHIMSQLVRKVEGTMKKAAATSVVPFGEIKHALANISEYSNAKAVFVVLGTIFTLLIGYFTPVTWGFVVFTVVHFIMRIVANRYRGQNDYIRLQRNIGLFLWSYILLAIGNTLGRFVSINGLPEGTFTAFIQLVLVWSELKGIVESAKLANLPVPRIIERIVNLNRDPDINPPF